MIMALRYDFQWLTVAVLFRKNSNFFHSMETNINLNEISIWSNGELDQKVWEEFFGLEYTLFRRISCCLLDVFGNKNIPDHQTIFRTVRITKKEKNDIESSCGLFSELFVVLFQIHSHLTFDNRHDFSFRMWNNVCSKLWHCRNNTHSWSHYRSFKCKSLIPYWNQILIFRLFVFWIDVNVVWFAAANWNLMTIEVKRGKSKRRRRKKRIKGKMQINSTNQFQSNVYGKLKSSWKSSTVSFELTFCDHLDVLLCFAVMVNTIFTLTATENCLVYATWTKFSASLL